MRVTTLETANKNCRVYQLGWCYPIYIQNFYHFEKSKSVLIRTFGDPAFKYQFNKCSLSVKDRYTYYYPKQRRWFAGNRLWNNTSPRDYWLVFRSNADRTLALLMLPL